MSAEQSSIRMMKLIRSLLLLLLSVGTASSAAASVVRPFFRDLGEEICVDVWFSIEITVYGMPSDCSGKEKAQFSDVLKYLMRVASEGVKSFSAGARTNICPNPKSNRRRLGGNNSTVISSEDDSAGSTHFILAMNGDQIHVRELRRGKFVYRGTSTAICLASVAWLRFIHFIRKFRFWILSVVWTRQFGSPTKAQESTRVEKEETPSEIFTIG